MYLQPCYLLLPVPLCPVNGGESVTGRLCYEFMLQAVL